MAANKKLRMRGALAVAAILSIASCQGETPEEVDRIAPLLAQEQAQALAAERIGPEGGTISLTGGELDGFSLEIPAGALGADAVFSIYAAKQPDEKLGYKPLGPFVKVWSSVDSLLADALITVPYSDESEPDEKRTVLLARSEQTLPIGGAILTGLTMRGLIRTFGEFGVAVDLSQADDGDGDGDSGRCERLTNGISMRSAISSSGWLAALSLNSDAAPLSVRSYKANGCGYSAGWEVTWYSSEVDKIEVYSTWATGSTWLSQSTLSCTPASISATVDSPGLTDDFAVRWGSTPQELTVSALNCNTFPVRTPPRIRLTAVGTEDWVEYDLAGAFVAKGF